MDATSLEKVEGVKLKFWQLPNHFSIQIVLFECTWFHTYNFSLNQAYLNLVLILVLDRNQ